MTDIVLDRLIRRGGRAEVWRGRRLLASGTWQDVAIKKILSTGDPEALERLDREAELCVDMNHQHVVKVMDYRRVGDERWLVMEYIEGVNLAELHQHTRGLPLRVLRALCCDVLEGLRYIHEFGLLHRDVSPRNILITSDGEARLVDFGLCEDLENSEHSPVFEGTPAYASFEALTGGELDESSDLYSLAAVLYEILIGVPPFSRDAPDVIAEHQRRGTPLRPLPDLLPKDFRVILWDLLRRQEQRKLDEADKVLAVMTLIVQEGDMAAPAEIALLVADAIAARQPALDTQMPAEPDKSAARAARDESPAAPDEPAQPRPHRRRWPLAAALAAILAIPAAYCGLALVRSDRASPPGPGDHTRESPAPLGRPDAHSVGRPVGKSITSDGFGPFRPAP